MRNAPLQLEHAVCRCTTQLPLEPVRNAYGSTHKSEQQLPLSSATAGSNNLLHESCEMHATATVALPGSLMHPTVDSSAAKLNPEQS